METTSLTFGSPLWLWGLAALPLVAGLMMWTHRRGRAMVEKIVAPRLRSLLAGSVSTSRRVFRAVLILGCLALILIALAQPRSGFIELENKAKGRDVIIAVDTSRSMLATDVPPTRLARAKLLTQDLLRLLRGDRVGLVAFAGSAFLQAPLTLDYSAVINALDELDTNVIPRGGTNLAAAIRVAEEAFGKAEGQTRALIILTDGEELDADGVAAARSAAEKGIRIFTVGIGSPEGSLIPIRTEDGRQDFVRDQAGKPVQSKLDESRLAEIASATGGFYVTVGPEAARELFQRGIEPMDRTEAGVFSSRQPIEKYQWPLAAAIGLLALWLILGERRRQTARLAGALLLGGFLFHPTTSLAQSNGLEAYRTGNFEEAKKDFTTRLTQSPDSPKLQFNAGAAAYKLGDFEQAVEHFTAALRAADRKLREDASYNLANALVRRGEAASDPKSKKADWESAIENYSETLNIDPNNKQAEENRDIVKKLLEDLEKQQQQQDQKDDQKKDDQQKQDQQNKDDQQKSDDQKQDQNQKNDQKNDQKQDNSSQDEQDRKQDQGDQKKNDRKNDSQNKQDDQQDGKESEKDEPSKSDKSDQKNQNQKPDPSGKKDEQPAAPTPTPGEKKEGDLKANQPEEPKEGQQGQEPSEAAAGAEPEEREGEMSPAQARGLLNSLRSEEEKVNLMLQQSSQEVLKDW